MYQCIFPYLVQKPKNYNFKQPISKKRDLALPNNGIYYQIICILLNRKDYHQKI